MDCDGYNTAINTYQYCETSINQGEIRMKHILAKTLILGVLSLSITAAVPMGSARFDGPGPIPNCGPTPIPCVIQAL
jgi:hypothetical protein